LPRIDDGEKCPTGGITSLSRSDDDDDHDDHEIHTPRGLYYWMCRQSARLGAHLDKN
jgi:hypothetical protein